MLAKCQKASARKCANLPFGLQLKLTLERNRNENRGKMLMLRLLAIQVIKSALTGRKIWHKSREKS